MYLYLVGLSLYLSSVSNIPLANPLYPCAKICPLDPTATAPILVEGSFDHSPTAFAISKYRKSHLFDKIKMPFINV